MVLGQRCQRLSVLRRQALAVSCPLGRARLRWARADHSRPAQRRIGARQRVVQRVQRAGTIRVRCCRRGRIPGEPHHPGCISGGSDVVFIGPTRPQQRVLGHDRDLARGLRERRCRAGDHPALLPGTHQIQRGLQRPGQRKDRVAHRPRSDQAVSRRRRAADYQPGSGLPAEHRGETDPRALRSRQRCVLDRDEIHRARRDHTARRATQLGTIRQMAPRGVIRNPYVGVGG